MVLTFLVVTWTKSAPFNLRSPTSSQHKGVPHLLPYKVLYRAIPIMAWWLLLYVNSTNAICSSQFPLNFSIHARNKSSKTWLTLSDWPSVWGWNAHIQSCPQGVLYARLKSRGEPRILIWDNGYWNLMEPCHLIYLNIGKLSTELVIFIGRNNANFVKRSTMTYIAPFPFLHLGNPNTKSMMIIPHFHSGICNGCNDFAGIWCSTLSCWHTSYLDTYSAISLFILGH